MAISGQLPALCWNFGEKPSAKQATHLVRLREGSFVDTCCHFCAKKVIALQYHVLFAYVYQKKKKRCSALVFKKNQVLLPGSFYTLPSNPIGGLKHRLGATVKGKRNGKLKYKQCSRCYNIAPHDSTPLNRMVRTRFS